MNKMKKSRPDSRMMGKKMPRLIETSNILNECPKCFKEVILKKYKGIDEGSNKLNGSKVYLGICKNNCPYVFWVPPIKRELDGDYRIVKVN